MDAAQNKTRQRAGVIVGVVLLVVIVGAIVAVLSGGQRPQSNDREAIAQCEARVEKELKSPATADFDSTAAGTNPVTVTGTVDSQNSFGATVRSEYKCTVTVDEDTATTQIEYLRAA